MASRARRTWYVGGVGLDVGRMFEPGADRAHFGAWVITSAPLILGHRATDNETNAKIWPLVSNELAIEINQG